MTTIEKYRQSHRISRQYVDRDGRSVAVCATDGLRVHAKKGAGWYHDATEVREAAQARR